MRTPSKKKLVSIMFKNINFTLLTKDITSKLEINLDSLDKSARLILAEMLTPADKKALRKNLKSKLMTSYKSKDGSIIFIKSMTNSHIENALRYFKNSYRKTQEQIDDWSEIEDVETLEDCFSSPVPAMMAHLHGLKKLIHSIATERKRRKVLCKNVFGAETVAVRKHY